MKHLLFSYGTLQLEKVQLETFGRKLKGTKEVLEGYKIEQLKITDPDVLEKSQQEFHPIAIKTDIPTDTVEGVLFEITQDELDQSDRYEVDDYVRKLVRFKSGKEGWIYVENS